MTDIKSIIKDTIYYEYCWVSGKDSKPCELYITVEKIYYSEAAATGERSFYVYKNKSIERAAYAKEAYGKYYYVQFDTVGDGHRALYFAADEHGAALADEIFKTITERIK